MSNSFFSVQHFFNHWGKPCGKFVEKNSPIFKKEKTPEGANSSKTPANRGNSRQNRKNGFPAIYSRPHDQRSLGTLRKRWKPVFAPPRRNPVNKGGGGPLEKPVENTKSPSLGRPRKGTAQRGAFSSTITGTERQFGGSPPGWPRRTAPPWWSGSRSADRR